MNSVPVKLKPILAILNPIPNLTRIHRVPANTNPMMMKKQLIKVEEINHKKMHKMGLK